MQIPPHELQPFIEGLRALSRKHGLFFCDDLSGKLIIFKLEPGDESFDKGLSESIDGEAQRATDRFDLIKQSALLKRDKESHMKKNKSEEGTSKLMPPRLKDWKEGHSQMGIFVRTRMGGVVEFVNNDLEVPGAREEMRKLLEPFLNPGPMRPTSQPVPPKSTPKKTKRART